MITSPNWSRARRGFLKAIVATASTLVLTSAMSGAAMGQSSWPSGTVQFVVPASPGGGTDIVARIVAEGLQQKFGTPFIVVNMPGGGGAVSAELVRNSKPDGNTLLFYHTGFLANYHAGLYPNDPLDTFSVVSLLPTLGSTSITVAADSPYQSLADLIQAAKEKPNNVSVGVGLMGLSHFMAGLLETDSGAKFRLVDAGSDSDKLVQVQGHQIEAALINTPGTRQYVENGDLRVLATISGNPERDPISPDTPSVAELGYENVVLGLDLVVLGQKEIPEELQASINAAIAETILAPENKERLDKAGWPLGEISLADGRARFSDSSALIGETAVKLGLK